MNTSWAICAFSLDVRVRIKLRVDCQLILNRIFIYFSLFYNEWFICSLPRRYRCVAGDRFKKNDKPIDQSECHHLFKCELWPHGHFSVGWEKFATWFQRCRPCESNNKKSYNNNHNNGSNNDVLMQVNKVDAMFDIYKGPSEKTPMSALYMMWSDVVWKPFAFFRFCVSLCVCVLSRSNDDLFEKRP